MPRSVCTTIKNVGENGPRKARTNGLHAFGYEDNAERLVQKRTNKTRDNVIVLELARLLFVLVVIISPVRHQRQELGTPKAGEGTHS